MRHHGSFISYLVVIPNTLVLPRWILRLAATHPLPFLTRPNFLFRSSPTVRVTPHERVYSRAISGRNRSILDFRLRLFDSLFDIGSTYCSTR